ncbi:MAG: glycosyltransferase family 4 protein [Polyangiales bacterium]
MRLAVVVQRYAADVTGGAEYHARRVAEHLAQAGHDVTVLTSTSRDARRWDDAYPAGVTREGGVRVHRFPVRRRLWRNLARLAESARTLLGDSPVTLGQAWSMWANPYVPEMIEHLARNEPQYRAVFFFTYFYYPSLVGSLVAPTFRIGVPLGHDDEDFSTPVVRRMLRAFDAIVANSEDEQRLIEGVLGGVTKPITVAGCGIDPPPARIPPPPIDAPYVVYLGRIKNGTEVLAPAMRRFRAKHGAELFERGDGTTFRGSELVFAAVGDPDLGPQLGHGWFVAGHVDADTRWAWTAGSEVLINPSLYESLSLTLLEAWWVGRPVLARAQCAVMANQVARAEGGETFFDVVSFADALADLLRSRARRAEMGARGQLFARARYGWPAVMERYAEVLAKVPEHPPVHGEPAQDVTGKPGPVFPT